MSLLSILGVSLIGCGNERQASTEYHEVLATGPCPDVKGLDLPQPGSRELERAFRGRFDVFGTATRLRPPINWAKDPLEAHRYRQNLYKLRFLKVLLGAYVRDNDRRALRQALAVLLDFAQEQPLQDPKTLTEAWSDKVVGDRAAIVGFIAGSAGCEGFLDQNEASRLLDLGIDHGRYLAAESHYVPNNHGLFVDRGLYLTAEYFPYLAQADEWRRIARERFEDTLRGRLWNGIWLEHSSAYQFLAIRAVGEFIHNVRGDPELERIAKAMRSSASWLVEPDGMISQFGDSNLDVPPAWARLKAEGQEGLRGFFGAGLAVVRESSELGPGYLAVTASFHNLTHKHADELSFELYDGGHRIVSDSGLFHKDPGAEREFMVSPQAHSTLTVDDRAWPIDDNRRDYGAALSAVGSGHGWYGILGRNPLVADQGVRHSRLFLYRPGSALLVIDRLRADSRHHYSRYFQIGPDFRSRGKAEPAVFRANGLTVQVGDASRGSRQSMYRGQSSPLGGYTAPGFRELVPRWTLALETDERSADHVVVFNLQGPPLRAAARKAGNSFVVTLHGDNENAALVVRRDGRHLEINRLSSLER